jgi:hypothetical protein
LFCCIGASVGTIRRGSGYSPCLERPVRCPHFGAEHPKANLQCLRCLLQCLLFFWWDWAPQGTIPGIPGSLCTRTSTCSAPMQGLQLRLQNDPCLGRIPRLGSRYRERKVKRTKTAIGRSSRQLANCLCKWAIRAIAAWLRPCKAELIIACWQPGLHPRCDQGVFAAQSAGTRRIPNPGSLPSVSPVYDLDVGPIPCHGEETFVEAGEIR